MDSTNLFQRQQQPNLCTYAHRGLQQHRELSTIRATHNDMIVYHCNKLHVVKVPVVVRDRQLDETEETTLGGLTLYPGNVLVLQYL